MILPQSACLTLRSTCTTTVFSPLSETITPVSTRFGMSRSLLRGRTRTSVLHGLDASDIATDFAHPARLFELVGHGLETEVERLALQVAELFAQLVVGLRVDVVDAAHLSPPRCEVSPRRATTLVLIGSFIAARLNASAASGPSTPSSSNRMRPGLTRAAQKSGEPLPLPMRTSAGLLDTGTSGKTRIQRRPWRLMWRVLARRAASLWRAVLRSGSIAFSP